MVRTFCRRGESEAVKGAVHAAGGGLAALMAAYNIAAWCYRRERHLGLNAIIYSVAVLWEVKQTRHHIGHSEPIAVATAVATCPAIPLTPGGVGAAVAEHPRAA